MYPEPSLCVQVTLATKIEQRYAVHSAVCIILYTLYVVRKLVLSDVTLLHIVLCPWAIYNFRFLISFRF